MANPKNGCSSTALATVDAAIDRQVKYGSICLRETPGRIKSTVSLGNVKNNRLVACTFGGGPRAYSVASSSYFSTCCIDGRL